MKRTLTPDDNATPAQPESAEIEFVLGRRQLASVTFLFVVLLAAGAGGAYLLGKGTATVSAAAPPPVEDAHVPPPPPVVEPEPAPAPPPEPPLFGQPIQGVIYIQMGAVEKGIAEIFAEGLRKRGFASFVAPGPNERIFRVLIGPFRSQEEYQASKASLDGMGLATFARRYQE
jgi:cell division septation protein DedD